MRVDEKWRPNTTLMQLLFSYDWNMRIEKALMQTLACRNSYQLSCNSCSRLTFFRLSAFILVDQNHILISFCCAKILSCLLISSCLVPLLTALSSKSPEIAYSVVCHIEIILHQAPVLFEDSISSLYCRYTMS